MPWELPNDRIALLTPGMSDQTVERAVPTEDTEQPGMGAAMGGTVGGAMGDCRRREFGSSCRQLVGSWSGSGNRRRNSWRCTSWARAER